MRNNHHHRDQHHGRKRPKQWSQEEEPEVDDMAVAASFAMQQPVVPQLPVDTTPVNPLRASVVNRRNDENEIELDEASNESVSSSPSTHASKEEHRQEDSTPYDDIASSLSPSNPIAADVVPEDDGDDDDDDDEDDDDEEEIPKTKVEDEGFDDDESNSNVKSKAGANELQSVVPKTENEIDLYRAPLSELETRFHLDLALKDQEEQLIGVPHMLQEGHVELLRMDLSLAGRVRNHLIVERTIVVESTGSGPPLDEGSLLVIRVTDPDQRDEQAKLIPLGKILEVFGPIRKPLYSIRLPMPTEKAASAKNPEPTTGEIQQSCNQALEASSGTFPIRRDTTIDACAGNSTSADKSVSKLVTDSEPELNTSNAINPLQILSEQDGNAEIGGSLACLDRNQTTNNIYVQAIGSTTIGIRSSDMNSNQIPSAGGGASSVDEINPLDTAWTAISHPIGDKTLDESDKTHLQRCPNPLHKGPGNDESIVTPSQPNSYDDPWSESGKYTNILEAMNDKSVYYIANKAKLIDTVAIIRTSGRGCDASNLYDEEVVNVDEMYFSDDEQERHAREQKKRGKNSSSRPPRRHSDKRDATERQGTASFQARPAPQEFHSHGASANSNVRSIQHSAPRYQSHQKFNNYSQGPYAGQYYQHPNPYPPNDPSNGQRVGFYAHPHSASYGASVHSNISPLANSGTQWYSQPYPNQYPFNGVPPMNHARSTMPVYQMPPPPPPPHDPPSTINQDDTMYFD